MKTRTHAIVGLAVLALLCAGCKGLQGAVKTTADILQQNPELIKNQQTREKVLAGAQAAKSLVSEIDTPEELGMGQSLAVRAFASFGKPYSDEQVQQYVATVGKLVALQSERPTLPYSFAVVQSDTPNALALPGGFVFVSTGLLKSLKSESELACILAHEVCHVAQKHGIQIVDRDRKISSLVDFGAAMDKDVAQYRQLIDLMYTKLTTEGYDRGYEDLADEAGTRYAFQAGYNPSGLVPFLEASAKSSKPLAFEVFKTHPDPKARIKNIQQVLASLADWSRMPKLEARYSQQVLSRLR